MIEKSRKQHDNSPSSSHTHISTVGSSELSDISGSDMEAKQSVKIMKDDNKIFVFNEATLPVFVTSAIDVKNNKIGEIARFLSRI
jgi:hypothetical protein